MNGTRSDGSRRPSVWSVLEGIGAPPHGFPPTGDEAERGGDGETRHDPNDDQDMFSDNSSIMVYSPLIPTRDSHVELAELVPVSIEEEVVVEGSPQAGTSWTSVWPLSIFSGAKADDAPQLPVAKRLSGEVVISPRRTSVDEAGRRIRTQTVRAWVPSDTKLSVQAMWWGYRLYLPPPVLAILSDKTIEATKRAAMITTALTWFFNNLPVSSLPLAVQPAALLLRRLAPYLGYIGTFISWSWSTIKSFGVTLTATWLLPIALIPGTWHEYDFPKSPSPPPAAPLPPPDSPVPTSPPTSLPTSPGSPSTTDPSLPTSPDPASPSLPTNPAPSDPPTATPVPATPIPDSGLPTPIPDTTPLPDTPSPPVSSPTPSTSGGKWKLPKGPTSPRSFWPRALSPSRTSSSSNLPTITSHTTERKTVEIPVPPTPPELPPVPPIPTERPKPANKQGVIVLEEVPIGSPLMQELLNGPVLGPVPLPDEDAPSPAEDLKAKKKEKAKKGLFGLGVRSA
ncbi:hypothetical protein NLJ89_g4375 [Agrocybe chaxingu]|uniref:Uncharacterized protein n=1 Tax=Agrocybe chaxingu TaxID=84603 RepID=A0A9W8MW06_9AGAR|nr:hypothetical protein NLJ89_g4375 [Agrocybe chaxingu]